MTKTILLTIAVAGLASPLFADGTNVLSDEKSKVSYAIGYKIGTGWKQNGVEVDNDIVMKGLTDAMAGNPPLLNQQEVGAVLMAYQKTLQQKHQEMMVQEAAANKAEGEAFLATNKNNPGVITLADGLQYKVLTDGNGPVPTKTSRVTVNYAGRFINGEEFDSSARAGHPAQFPVTGVIPGWTEVLQLMKVGSKWQVYIPGNLAYGERGSRGIPPNKTLIFDVELLNAENPPQVTAPPPAPNPQLTSDIIKVPSQDEMKKGAKIEVIKPEDVAKAQAQAQAQSQTNSTAH